LGLKALFETLLRSLPALWNVGALLLLIFFIYSYVGVLTFGEVTPMPALFLQLCSTPGRTKIVFDFWQNRQIPRYCRWYQILPVVSFQTKH
jgi:Kef-type K+ transport system membrane component KefB